MLASGGLVFRVIDVPAEGADVRGEVAFAALDITDDGVFSFPQTLKYELTLAAVQDGVLVRGHLTGHVVRLCDRCVEPCELPLEIADVCHHFEHALGTEVDLTEVLREDILLALPQAWVCRSDCLGLCPRCGRNRNEADCQCRESASDAEDDHPWDVLSDLIQEDKPKPRRR